MEKRGDLGGGFGEWEVHHWLSMSLCPEGHNAELSERSDADERREEGWRLEAGGGTDRVAVPRHRARPVLGACASLRGEYARRQGRCGPALEDVCSWTAWGGSGWCAVVGWLR